jgi:hypothetical protein
MSTERPENGDMVVEPTTTTTLVDDAAAAAGAPVDINHPQGDNNSDDSSSSDDDSDDAGQTQNPQDGDGAEDDLLLGIGLDDGPSQMEGGAPAVGDDEDLSPKKEKRSKDKKSKKDKSDKKSKKDKHKDKKSKDKKSKKDKHKKDKHGKRDRGGLDDMEAYAREAAESGVERRRRRKERQATDAHDDEGQSSHYIESRFTKRGTSNVELKHLQGLLEASLVPHGDGYDVNSIHEVLVQLASLEVTYENLVSSRIGQTVGRLLSAEYHDLMQGPFANAILRYWFLRLSEDRRKQLVRVDELENASVASQFDAREEPEEMATLNRIGVEIEKSFTIDELDAAGVVDASHIAGALSDLLAVDEDVRELVLNRLKASHNKALRVKLLKGEVQASELVNHPDVVGVSETQRRRDYEQEEEYLNLRTL